MKTLSASSPPPLVSIADSDDSDEDMRELNDHKADLKYQSQLADAINQAFDEVIASNDATYMVVNNDYETAFDDFVSVTDSDMEIATDTEEEVNELLEEPFSEAKNIYTFEPQPFGDNSDARFFELKTDMGDDADERVLCKHGKRGRTLFKPFSTQGPPSSHPLSLLAVRSSVPQVHVFNGPIDNHPLRE
ncbi:hypothetical protein HGRIS_001293 [Hohenbuehelia grisea]|uniref:Uncharacterized protein n=1 Tax=Hohenbuehelia grisea TaxID=104357 RepID=A0ABR3JNW6_9AGAR